MTRHLSLLVFSFALLLGTSVSAQSLPQAQGAYEAFVQAANGGTKAAMYNALYEAYRQNLALLQAAPRNSAEHTTARKNLLELWPQLEKAAMFYSSQGKQANAKFMAEAYLNMPQMDEFKGNRMNYGANLGQLSYFVASRYFNGQDYGKAIPYLELYLRSGEEKNRKNVIQCLVKACKEECLAQKGLAVVADAVNRYPDDFNVLSIAINFCLDAGEKAALEMYVKRASALRPNDPTLQNIQKNLQDKTGQFDQTMAVNHNKMLAGANRQAANLPAAGTGKIPSFSEFAKDMIETAIKEWQAKDPYETATEYQARVTEQARNAKVAELKKKAEGDYIAAYGGALSPAQFSLKPYDAENGVFLIEGALGQLVVPVPRDNNEARLFEQNWNGILLNHPQYCIVNDQLALSAVTFTTPAGKSYQFTNDQALSYTETQVDVHFDAIDYSGLAQNTSVQPAGVKVNKQKVSAGQSDVDMNIPQGAKGDDKTFVLIIANEHYKAVAEVPFTTNDGRTFAEYCKKTLGLPEANVHMTTDATFIDMRRQIKWLTDVLTAFEGEGRAIVYYAGHGIPDEATRSAYLLPVDGDGTDVNTGFSLAELYKTLGSIPSRGVMVLLDACFSGATREGGMLASARGVAIKAKPEAPQGSLVVLSAATGDETAWPYKDQGHGLFTYYLLKKLQESKGAVTLGELSRYVTDEVHKRSLVVNGKSQTPTVSAPAGIGESWKAWTLK